MGHGRTTLGETRHAPEADESALIAEATDAIAKHGGKGAGGWMTPLQAESEVSPDLLKEAGYRIRQLACDDRPTDKDPLRPAPQRAYAVETNDYGSGSTCARTHQSYADVVRARTRRCSRESRAELRAGALAAIR